MPEIKIKDEWVSWLLTGIDNVEDQSCVIVMGCLIAIIDKPRKRLCCLSMWKDYPKTFPGLVFFELCEKMGFPLMIAKETTQMVTPEVLTKMMTPADEALVIHPGIFEGTWPAAERDYTQNWGLPPGTIMRNTRTTSHGNFENN